MLLPIHLYRNHARDTLQLEGPLSPWDPLAAAEAAAEAGAAVVAATASRLLCGLMGCKLVRLLFFDEGKGLLQGMPGGACVAAGPRGAREGVDSVAEGARYRQTSDCGKQVRTKMGGV